MKKTLAASIALVLVLSLSAVAFAGGGAGPDKNMLKGVITEVDAANRTAVFMKDGQAAPMTVALSEALDLAKVPMNRKVMLNMEHHGEETVVGSFSVMFMDMTPNRILALIVVGLVGGLLSGFIGSGGAFVLTPAMMSLGVPGAVAVASNMCHKFPKALVGAYKRWKYGQADVKLGVVMAATAIVGVQIGIKVQKSILAKWGNAGSNLYVSVAFVLILVLVGAYVFYDAWKLARGGNEASVPKLALMMQKINIPPMMHFKTANITISAWITIPVGLATGMLAATIAVGGFVGVPGMIYVMGASAMVASATELVVAFVMGMWGSVQWGLSGLIDIRLTLLILSASLIGVQLGAIGTTYVKDHIIKIVMGSVMLIVAVSRGAKIPGYLADLGLRDPLGAGTASLLNMVSFWALVAALATAGLIITFAMMTGISKAKKEALVAEKVEAVGRG